MSKLKTSDSSHKRERTLELHKYIEKIGPTKFSELVGVSVEQAHKYKNLKNAPHPRTARKIVELTHGLVDYKDIFEPYLEAQDQDPQLAFNFEDN